MTVDGLFWKWTKNWIWAPVFWYLHWEIGVRAEFCEDWMVAFERGGGGVVFLFGTFARISDSKCQLQSRTEHASAPFLINRLVFVEKIAVYSEKRRNHRQWIVPLRADSLRYFFIFRNLHLSRDRVVRYSNITSVINLSTAQHVYIHLLQIDPPFLHSTPPTFSFRRYFLIFSPSALLFLISSLLNVLINFLLSTFGTRAITECEMSTRLYRHL